MSNNIYYPKFEIVNNRNIRVGENTFYNKDYVVYSNLFNLSRNTINYTNFSTLKSHIDELKLVKGNKVETILNFYKDITNWLNDDSTNVTHVGSHGRYSSTQLVDLLTSKIYFGECSFSRSWKRYRIGYYSLMETQSDNMCFVLVVKKEYSRYIKLCTLLGEPILEDCFEFWYDRDAVARTADAKVVKALNKLIKELTSIDVPCIAKQNILSLFQPEIKFTAPTISRQKEMINEFAEEFRKEELKIMK